MRFARVGVTPHLIRDIFATEYLKQHPGDAAGVAKRLGNTIQVVYKHYAHLLDQEADARADTSSSRGCCGTSARAMPRAREAYVTETGGGRFASAAAHE
jgi:hypothetical protein